MSFEGVIQSGKVYLQKGRLRHRVQIVQPTLSQDSTGGWNISANNVILTTWASIEALTVSEKFAAKQFASQVSHRVIIRNPRSAAPQGITAKMQVWYNGRQFQVEGVLNPDERPDALVLICMELNDSAEQSSASPSESTI